MSDVDAAIAALTHDKVAVIPTDTVYGLAARPDSERAVTALYAVKERDPQQPTAIVAVSVEVLEELVPELAEYAHGLLCSVLPGPFTLVLPNPARRLPWLNLARPDAIGVRVPDVAGVAAELLAGVGAVAATSANRPGGRDPVRLADVPPALLRRVAIALDGGDLPGVPSSVIDFTREQPVVLREGAGDVALALTVWNRR